MVQWLMVLLPLGLNVAAVLEENGMLLAASLAALLLMVALMPAARKRESLFLFVLAAISLIPMNLWAVVWFLGTGYLEDLPLISKLFWPVLIYWMVFNIEQVILGCVARLIWPKQYKNVFWEAS